MDYAAFINKLGWCRFANLKIDIDYIKIVTKKFKIILYLPLILFFIVNLFYFSIPVKAEEVCTWNKAPDCTNLGTQITVTAGATPITPESKCGVTKPSECSGFAYCSCCCKTVTSSGLNDSMPNFKMPDLQIKIPGLTFTSADQIKASCREENGKKICNFPWVGEYIAGIYKYAIGIVGILAAVVLMIGGVIWIVAGGSATMIGEAKAWIGASLTGLVIALCSYAILYQVNPALLNFKGLDITLVEKIKVLVSDRTGGTAEQYKNLPCNVDLNTGVDFYATGYIKPANDNSKYSLCMVAMNCTCPGGEAGRDLNSNCDEYFPNYKNYHPCKSFSGNNYCNKNSSGKEPQIGDVAVDYSCFNKEQQICVNKNGNKTTYTARDSGGGIKGRRIDIWSGNSIDTANKNSGVVNITIGACRQ